MLGALQGWCCYLALWMDSYMGTCTGGINDSRYMKMVNFFEKQQLYTQYDDEMDHH